MQPKIIIVVSLLFSIVAKAQLPSSSYSYNCPKDTTVPCNANCITVTTQIPNIKSATSNYVVNKLNCFRQPVPPGQLNGSIVGTAFDDIYSQAIILPFTFPFYENNYDQLVIGTNGTVSFDLTNAGRFATWQVNSNLPSLNYERAVIMFPFQDIDVTQGTSPTKLLKYELTGTAPHRKWVVSFYKIPLYVCSTSIENTYQLALHEGTGIVEILVNSRQVCPTWNNQGGIIGMQDYSQTKGIMAPGRTALDNNWGGVDINESWRFTPAVGQSLLKSTKLYKLDGTFVANGDTADAGNGNYNVSFNNVCLGAATFGDYVAVSSYYDYMYFLDPVSFIGSDSIIYSTDTIYVVKAITTPQLSIVNADCANGNNGSITVTSPVGPACLYAINNGPFGSSNSFQQLAPGIYNITVINTDGCFFDARDTVGTNYQQQDTLRYPRQTYCFNETPTPLPALTGSNTGGYYTASPAGLIINSATGQVTPQGSDTNVYTITYHLNNPPQCTAPTASATIRIVGTSQFIWTGASSNAWENATNWSCNNLPTSASNVFIYEGNVVINSNVTVNSLTVSPGASVSVSTGANLTVLHP